MRRMTRLFATVAASSALILTTAVPAGAAPPGREDQWWFSAWAIEQKVWPISKGAGVTVAVIDNGVNGRLPDLQGVLVPGTDVTPAGGDGQIPPTSDLEDSHGTGMAGLIASQGTGTGYVGVAPAAKIMSVKSDFSVWDKAIRYAADHGAKVISISQAFAAHDGCRPQVQEAISYAIQKDVVVVAGAGNDGDAANESMEPANCAGALAVGAVDNQKRPWAGSERQPYVAVAAPGYAVNALRADGKVATNLAGTSQATALTSAVAALMRSEFPKMSAREVVQRLINTTKDVGPPGKDDISGYGVVIPHGALTAKVPQSAPNPVFAAYDKWAKAHGGQVGATPSAKNSETPTDKSSEQAARNTKILIIGLCTAAVLGALLIIFFALRSKRKASVRAPAGGPQYGPPAGSGPPPGWGGPPGPPPGQQGGQSHVPPQGQGGPGPYPPR